MIKALLITIIATASVSWAGPAMPSFDPLQAYSINNTDELHLYFKRLSEDQNGQRKLKEIASILPFYFSGNQRMSVRHGLYVDLCMDALDRISETEKLSIHLVPVLLRVLRNDYYAKRFPSIGALLVKITGVDPGLDEQFIRLHSADREFKRLLNEKLLKWANWYEDSIRDKVRTLQQGMPE